MGTGTCIHVIDDSPTEPVFLQAAFETLGSDVDLRWDGTAEDALRRLRSDAARGQPPDAILLDLHLPDATGVQVLRTLAADAVLRRIPVLVSSASSDPAAFRACTDAGAAGCWTKHIGFDGTITLAQSLLALAQRRRQPDAADGG